MPWLEKSDFLMPADFDTIRITDTPQDVKPWVHWLDLTHLLFIWTAQPHEDIGVLPKMYAWPAELDPSDGRVTLGEPETVITVADDLVAFEYITRVEHIEGGGYVVFTAVDNGS